MLNAICSLKAGSPEQEERSPGLVQEEPQPPHIEEEDMEEEDIEEEEAEVSTLTTSLRSKTRHHTISGKNKSNLICT